MLRIASLNLNKRLSSEAAFQRAVKWIRGARVQALVAQEPWSATVEPVEIPGFAAIGGTSNVFAWIDGRLERPAWTQVDTYWQRLELGYVVVYNVYLDAYEPKRRAGQLMRLKKGVLKERDRPVLIVGDFNIAPTPLDGLCDGRISTFNSEIDRLPLSALMTEGGLIDLHEGTRTPTWTIERTLAGRLSQFRCDLALASNYMADAITLRYDHQVRQRSGRFTDHSALVLDLPVTLEPAHSQFDLFSSAEAETPSSTDRIHPHKTAMARRGPSALATMVLRHLHEPLNVATILDYGCGRGEDVRYYRANGVRAIGYDPHEPFGWSERPSGRFDLVTVVFVLNVLPDPWARLNVIREAAKHMTAGGSMLVAVRSPAEIQRHAVAGAWRSFNDGFISHTTKRTFQKGLTGHDIERLAERAGLRRHPLSQQMVVSAGVECVLLQNPIEDDG